MKILHYLLLFLILISLTYAQEDQEVEVYLFYADECSYCDLMQLFLLEMQEEYPTLTVVGKEVTFNEANRQLFDAIASGYAQEVNGVPTIYIADSIFVGYSNTIKQEIEDEIIRCISVGCASPISKIPQPNIENEIILGVNNETIGVQAIIEEAENTASGTSGGGGSSSDDESSITDSQIDSVAQDQTSTEDEIENKKVTPPISEVITSAIIDIVNPHAFLVLVLLIITILATHSRKRSLQTGIAFTLSIFISYLLLGLGLYPAFQLEELSIMFYLVMAVIAVLVGLFNLKYFLWPGEYNIPRSLKLKLNFFSKALTIPGATFMGFAISLFLPVAAKNYTIWPLILYNFIFILPLLIITIALYLGILSTEEAEMWREKRLRLLHLIGGILIIFLGIGIFLVSNYI